MAEATDKTVEILLAEMDINNVETITICEMLQATYEDVVTVRQSDAYKEAKAELLHAKVAYENSNTDGWLMVENAALKNLHVSLRDDPTNAELSLRAAAFAQKANASKRVLDMQSMQAKQGNVTNNVVVLTLNPKIAGLLAREGEATPNQEFKRVGMINAATLQHHLNIVPKDMREIDILDVDTVI